MKKKMVFYSISIFLFLSILTSLASAETHHDSKNKIRKDVISGLPLHGKNIQAFIPKGWKLIDQAVGDLNKDGLPDMAGVIEEIVSDADKYECSGEAKRILFIAFNKGNGRYKLSIQNNDIILTHDDGGIWGDPFVSNYSDQYQHGKNQETGIFVNRGSLLIKFYGGTSWRWCHKYRFRYQNKGWYLIGYDYEWYHTSGYKGEDTKDSYNYLTGKKNENFIGKETLINLDGYSPWEKD